MPPYEFGLLALRSPHLAERIDLMSSIFVFYEFHRGAAGTLEVETPEAPTERQPASEFQPATECEECALFYPLSESSNHLHDTGSRWCSTDLPCCTVRETQAQAGIRRNADRFPTTLFVLIIEHNLTCTRISILGRASSCSHGLHRAGRRHVGSEQRTRHENIAIMRTFVKLRQMPIACPPAKKLAELREYDGQFRIV